MHNEYFLFCYFTYNLLIILPPALTTGMLDGEIMFRSAGTWLSMDLPAHVKVDSE